MALISFWAGNFHQLRKILRNSCFELPKFHTRLAHGISVDGSSYGTLTTKEEKRLQKPKIITARNISMNLFDGKVGSARTMNFTESELHEVEDFQYYNPQQTVLDERIFDRPYVPIVLDIETSGFGKDARIIEIAAWDLCGGKNSTFETLVNPDKPVLNAHVHGISTNMVNNPDIPRFEEVIPIILQFVRSRQVDEKLVAWIVHNGRRFDVPFITREFHRCSAEIPSDWLFIDTLPLARKLVMPDGTKLASCSLRALREHYGIPLVGPAHRAMQDVITLSHVFQRITFDLKMTAQELLDTGFRASDITIPKVSR